MKNKEQKKPVELNNDELTMTAGGLSSDSNYVQWTCKACGYSEWALPGPPNECPNCQSYAFGF